MKKVRYLILEMNVITEWVGVESCISLLSYALLSDWCQQS